MTVMTTAPADAGIEDAGRFLELRTRLGLTQEQLGEIAGMSPSKIGKLERGERRLTYRDAIVLARALNCDPSDLLPGQRGLSIPIEWRISAAHSEAAPEFFEVPEPRPRLPALTPIARPDQCFGAEVLDDSADRLYPPGAVLICRHFDALAAPLRLGAKVIARRFVTSLADGAIMEVLVGLVDRSISGDLLLSLRTTNRELPPAVLIRQAPVHAGFADRFSAAYSPADRPIDYAPRPDDPAEILGVVVWAITPE
jgi:transcriptional regulator with XRE-family HTH domain